MGYKLLPGHAESGQLGLIDFSNPSIEFLNLVDIGNFQIGNFGEDFNESAKDKHAAHYSIPNPWASAYLFHNVMKHGSHALLNKVIEILLNILNDQYNYDKLDLIKYKEPDPNSPFYLFWKMAPEFIKYKNEGIYFLYFLKNRNNDIIGGLSRTTLVWASQKYKPEAKLVDLENNISLCSYLKYIKKQHEPEELFGLKTSTFWGYQVLRKMLDKGMEISSLTDYKVFPKSCLKKKSESDPTNSPYFYKGKLIFDENALSDPNILGGNPIPVGFISKLREEGSGEKLPLNQGSYKWTLFENLFEEKWIRMYQLDKKINNEFTYKGNENDDTGKVICNAYLFPVKPSYFDYEFNLEEVEPNRIDPGINRTRAASNFVQRFDNKKLSNRYSEEVDEDHRGLAIWPPFLSSIIPFYIMEYNREGFASLPQLEIFDEKGNSIEFEEIRKSKQNRLYKFKQLGKFPHYIRITTSDQYSGFLKFEPKTKKDPKERIIIGLDFGSTHTTIGYKINNEGFKLMTFENSSPIILSDESDEQWIINEFIPQKLLEEPPDKFEEYKENNLNWTPFRTLWREFEEQKKESDFLKGGVTALTYSPETSITSRRLFIENLKWDTLSQHREGFLRNLLYLIVVESEAMGAKNIEIRFAFPNAFSDNEKNAMVRFYIETMSKELNKNSDLTVNFAKPKSEAICTLEYFVQNHEGFNIKNRYATMDIGGGTTDITFMNNREFEFEDSVKFGGEVIEDINIKSLINLINECRNRKQLSEIPEGTRYSDFIRLWPGVDVNWGSELSNFISNKNKPIKFFQVISLFFSGLFFYLGLHLRRKNITKPLRKVGCAGGGTQYLKIISQNLPLNKEHIRKWIELFKAMLSAGQNINEEEYKNTEIYFTSDPKKEVTYGLLGDPDKFKVDIEMIKEPERIMGLSISKGSKSYNWDDKLPDKEVKSIDLSLMEIDFTIFEEFLKNYYEKVKDISQGLSRDFKIEDISTKFKDEVSRELTIRNELPLAAPLFFTALEVWIKLFT